VGPVMLRLDELVRAARASPSYAGWPLDAVTAFGDDAWQALPTVPNGGLAPSFSPGPATGELLTFSSGTTGSRKALRFATDDLDRVGALCARMAAFEGVGPGDTVMVLLPMGLWGVGRFTVLGHRRAGAHVMPVDLHGGVEAWEHMAAVARPTVLSSTPSVLASWAASYAGPAVPVIETTGERLLARERALIEERFGGRVHDAYGLSECVVGVECAATDGFHFWPDTVGVEVVRHGGDDPVPVGREGEIVVTSFMQARMPVLRYRTGDAGSMVDNPCGCGSAFPRVRLAGRVEETFELSRGVKVAPASMRAALVDVGVADVRVKSSPDAFVSSFVAPAVPVVELVLAADAAPDAARATVVTRFPDLAELLHEQELEVSFTTETVGG
jgi:phenylacetate-coenzyme A ligase PaaK-like adenylate-forming protein